MAANPKLTVAQALWLGGLVVKRVLVGAIRFIDHHSDRASSDPPGLSAGLNPPPGGVDDHGR